MKRRSTFPGSAFSLWPPWSGLPQQRLWGLRPLLDGRGPTMERFMRSDTIGSAFDTASA